MQRIAIGWGGESCNRLDEDTPRTSVSALPESEDRHRCFRLSPGALDYPDRKGARMAEVSQDLRTGSMAWSWHAEERLGRAQEGKFGSCDGRDKRLRQAGPRT